MVNVQEFLLNSFIDIGTYALVTYDNRTEAIYFSKYSSDEGGYWFLESPCQLYEMADIKEPIDDFAKNYAEGLLEEGADVETYINKYIKPMIIDNVLYEIENFQVSPYLPKEVDEIKLITERECLEYILEKLNEI